MQVLLSQNIPSYSKNTMLEYDFGIGTGIAASYKINETLAFTANLDLAYLFMCYGMADGDIAKLDGTEFVISPQVGITLKL